MVVSPLVILKRDGNGFTLAEILIAVAIIAVLAIFVLVGLRGMTQLQKARDTRRKSDLHLVSRALEEYYNDHGYYLPGSQYYCGGTALQPYLERIPCDIYRNLEKYEYVTDGSTRPPWYRLYTKLQYTSDPLIQYVGCFPGCVVGSETYNYFVASPNAPTTGGVGTTGGSGGTPTPTPTPTPGGGGGGATPTPTPTSTPTPTLTPTPTPLGGGAGGEPTPTPTPSGITCNNPVAPTCNQPELYVNQCASCCPGSEYITRFISGSYWCCYDPLICPGP